MITSSATVFPLSIFTTLYCQCFFIGVFLLMPTYEYECPDCQHRFEAEQRITEAALTACPKCSANNCRRLISATAFHLKGGGWYKTDYAGSSSSGSSSSTSSSASSSTSTSSESTTKSTDSAAETKPVKACGSNCGCH